jgi:macrolide-specific efflux system membrane fusion protein
MTSHSYRLVATSIILTLLLSPDRCSGEKSDAARTVVVVDRVFIKSFQEIDVPALKPGLLEEVFHREGDTVRAGEILAKLQDHQAAIALEQAETEASIARHLAENHLDLETTEKKLLQAVQAAKQQELELQAARLEAENLLRSQAAEKKEAVAKNEYERAKQSRASFIDSVSESELDSLRLSFERAGLETAQALFDTKLAHLKALAAQEAHQTQLLAVESAKVDVAQAKSRISVASFNADLKQAELKAAKLHIDQHRLKSMLEGVVVDVYRQPGEWVEPGEPVLRILRLNRLRAEAFVKLHELADDLGVGIENANTELEIVIGGKTMRFPGLITFVSPEIDPINRETSIWVEFDNADLHVKPGMHGELKIYPKKK